MTEVVHVNKSDYDIFCGRPSKWGNPFSTLEDSLAEFRVNTRKEAIEKHLEWIEFGDGKHLLNDLHELKGKKLGCFCFPLRCHCDNLVYLVNKYCNEDVF